jgi:hypothetical protein
MRRSDGRFAHGKSPCCIIENNRRILLLNDRQGLFLSLANEHVPDPLDLLMWVLYPNYIASAVNMASFASKIPS